MSVIKWLRHRIYRGLGIVSPSGAYPLPPRWALSPKGKHQFYDAPDCTSACCVSEARPYRCTLACCAAGATPVPGATQDVKGSERGTQGC